jgi:hypothetical protein
MESGWESQEGRNCLLSTLMVSIDEDNELVRRASAALEFEPSSVDDLASLFERKLTMAWRDPDILEFDFAFRKVP